jgi:hypothetical protein
MTLRIIVGAILGCLLGAGASWITARVVAPVSVFEGKILFLGLDSFASHWGGLFGWHSGAVAGGLAGGIGVLWSAREIGKASSAEAPQE